MGVSTLEDRMRTLETKLNRLRPNKECGTQLGKPINSGAANSLGQLEELQQEAKVITEQAKTARDLRTALASIRVRCCIVELAAKLRGDLDERSPTNILTVNLDSETAKRIAETYLDRHRSLGENSK